MRYNKNYIKKMVEDPLPPLLEEERIYLNVPYKARGFAQFCNCGFDDVKKLWFTGINNSNLHSLITLYGVNEATSEKTKIMLNDFLHM